MNDSYVLHISEIFIGILKQLPDESCRRCGGLLTNYAKCAECNRVNRMICTSCGSKTHEQFHMDCMHYVKHQGHHDFAFEKHEMVLLN